jgi:hypothetical protein
MRLRVALFALICLLAACEAAAAPPLRVRVRADGREVVFSATEPLSVGQILQREGFSIGPLDRLNPPDFTPIADGMVITLVRVENKADCIEESVPYQTETLKTTDLDPGVSRVLQAGINGTARVCYDVVLEDGIERSRAQSSRTILTPPANQIVAVGVDSSRIEPIAMPGFLTYISGGQARYIEGNSTTQGSLPTGGGLDGFVFALSPDGRQLLYTRKPESAKPDLFNELWVLLDTRSPNAKPVKLIIENVLTAEWVPGRPLTFSYSTLRPRSDPPGYQALNDLFIARLDGVTGRILSAEPILKTSVNAPYSAWGTQFEWSPDGQQLAWAQADGVGFVNLRDGTLERLIDFRIYETTLSRGWLWLPNLAWSRDGAVLAATVHGPPIGGEPPETSPAFDVAAVSAARAFVINPMFSRVGMWASPQFSPLSEGEGFLAYLQARTPNDSVNSEYDLIIADRDGSNPRTVFPGKERPGLIPFEDRTRHAKIVWSPDGRQIALIYQGDLYIVEADSGRATQVTVVGNVLSPRWVR